MFVVAILVASLSVNAMSPDRKFEYPEAQCFFENVDGHGHRRPWANGNSKRERLTLDFDGRKQFIESVRSSNDDEHINNFEVRVPINSELNVRTKFELKNKKNNKNNKHYSTIYGFSVDGEWKPYLYDITKMKNGILDDFVFARPSHPPLYSDYINHFAINVLRILKLSQKPLATDDPNRINRVANQCVMNTAVEIAAMILTTERARDEYSLLIFYIEFYKLKHTDRVNQQRMLLDMFNKSNPTLRFPQAPGGVSYIQGMQSGEIYNAFMNMLIYSPYYKKLQQLPEFMHDILVDLFYEGKLEKIKAISENRTTNKPAKFKKLVDASKNFFKFQMKKVIELWKAMGNSSEEISEPELESESDYFDPLDPAAEGHHEDVEFRNGKDLWKLEEEYHFCI